MIQRCQGFRDLLPDDMKSFRSVEGTFLDSVNGWGYREVRTPTIEYLYLFTSAGTLTPGKLRRTYSFLDWDGWSGERVVLRPDATIPVARMYSECISGESPARLSYVANTFMFDDSGKKTRERWQCGVELIGAGTPAADGELIAMASEVLGRLGIKDIRFRLSHSGLLAILLEKAGLEPEEYNRVFDELLDGNEAAFDRVKESSPELAQALTLMLGVNGKSAGYIKNLKALLEETLSGAEAVIDDFITITEIAQNLNIPCEINLASAKGYEYYTGVIFHVLSGEDIIGGGGRYDNLISLLGGPETPAAGFALYMDKLMHLSSRIGQDNVVCGHVKIKPRNAGPDEVLNICRELRSQGHSVEIDISNQKDPGTGWCIEVDRGSLRLIMADSEKPRSRQFNNIQELLQAIKKEKWFD